MKKDYDRRKVLGLLGKLTAALCLAPLTGCSIFRGGQDDSLTGGGYLDTKTGWVRLPDGTFTDDGDVYRQAVKQLKENHQVPAGGHCPTPAVLGSTSGNFANFPWDASFCNGLCPVCGKAPLIQLRSEYFPLGEDGDGQSPPMYKTYGACADPSCLSGGQEQYLPGSKRPAPAPRTINVDGAFVYPLPAGGWFMPRLPMPAGIRFVIPLRPVFVP